MLPADQSPPIETDSLTLVARFAHIADPQLVDEQSPARFAGAREIAYAAWRPFEAYSAQLLDGAIRQVNRIHASGRKIDFVMIGGDLIDNAQRNELDWFLTVMDGGVIDPLSGPDDRAVRDRPSPLDDPHATFESQGLYRTGVHGPLPSVPWYVVVGNHDVQAIGLFRIEQRSDGSRVAPLPLPNRPGVWLPTVFNPIGSWAHGRVTPAEPGPPELFELPRYVTPNPDRAYITRDEFVAAMFETDTSPAGHGFSSADGVSWYSVSPVAGVRLIGLDTTDIPSAIPGGIYEAGGMSQEQTAFFQNALDEADRGDDVVIVCTHHPSESFGPFGSPYISTDDFRSLLAAQPNPCLHLAGHGHFHRVRDQGDYLEIETASTLDMPQESRLVEIWRDDLTGDVYIVYETFSHLDDNLPSLDDDPLKSLRQQAYELALDDKRQTWFKSDESSIEYESKPHDRRGVFVISSP